MRSFTLFILALLLGSSWLCRKTATDDAGIGTERHDGHMVPKDTSLPFELQQADSLIIWRKYSRARDILKPYLDSTVLPPHLQMRATGMWCYAAMRDTSVVLRNESYKKLRQFRLPGHSWDTLLLAQQALSLGNFYMHSERDSAQLYFGRALRFAEAYFDKGQPGAQRFYRDITPYYLIIALNMTEAYKVMQSEQLLHDIWDFPPFEKYLLAYHFGVFYRKIEEYDLAESYFQRAIHHIKEGRFDTTSTAILPYASLCYLYGHRNQKEKLSTYVDTCLSILNRYITSDTANYIDYHCSLAMCYIPGNANKPSLGHAILDLLSGHMAAIHNYPHAFADMYRARAYLYLGSGDMMMAQQAMHRAIELFEEQKAYDYYYSTGYGDALLGLGVFYLEDGKQVTEAMPYIRKAIDYNFHFPLEYAAMEYPARYLKYYFRWYDFLVAFGDELIAEKGPESIDEILHLSARIDTAISLSRQKVSDSDVLRNARLNHDIYTYMIDWCHTLTREAPVSGLLHQAFDHFEKSRAHLLLTQLSIDSLAYQLEVPPDIVEKGKVLTKEELISYMGLNEIQIDSLLAVKKQYFTLLEKNYPEYYHKSYQPVRTTLSEVVELIAEDEAIINYQLKDSQLYALVITTDSIQLVKTKFHSTCSNAADQLFAIVSSHPGPAIGQQDIVAYLQVASDVFECVLRDVYPFIRNKRQWWIAADGALELLPFEILVNSSSGSFTAFHDLPFLINDHDIGYLLSATTWVQERKRSEIHIDNIAVFAHSDGSHKIRGADRNSIFQGMPGTAKAAKAIEAVYGEENVQIFSNRKATVEVFYETWQTRDLLHLGLHAYADTSGAQRHGIFFPGGEKVLTIPDIIGKEAGSAIVFLEGCETAVGKQSRGEGTLNFARPFIAAGTRHVLASRWKLDDQTAGLMCNHFYQSLKEGKDVAVAACESKRVFISEAHRLQSHPYFWAAVMSIR